MITTNLRDTVVALLKNRPASLKFKQVSSDTTIPEGWLKMLARGKVNAPDSNRIETLYKYLTGNSLL